jgi:hypothetical protein
MGDIRNLPRQPFHPCGAFYLFDKTVIPGEQNYLEQDPESRKIVESQIILDPGSHPASRDLAGMTSWGTVSDGGELARLCGESHWGLALQKEGIEQKDTVISKGPLLCQNSP